MEEDNRFYPLSHPFRQYQYRRVVAESNTNLPTKCNNNNSNKDRPSSSSISYVLVTSAEKDESIESSTTKHERRNATATRRSSTTSCSSDRVLPMSLDFRTTTSASSIATDTNATAATNDHKTNHLILGMAPLKDDDDDDENGYRSLAAKTKTNNSPKNNSDDRSSYGNRSSNASEEHEEHNPSASSSSWFDDTQRLFQDYQRRFHRQSLTEQAKELLDRAVSLALTKNSNSCYNDNSNSLETAEALCTEALRLCRNAIENQEAALHENEDLGGSYLVTGDIRIRRKGEALETKIYCLRASIRYTAGKYSESLEDCDAALAIWKTKQNSATTTTTTTRQQQRERWFNPLGTKLPHESSSSSPKGTLSQPPHARSKTTRTANPRKSSHKYLCLLKGRVLAAMGLYRDAVVWLTHPDQFPTKNFQRSSALLETDAIMHRFLDQLWIQAGRRNIGGGDGKQQRRIDNMLRKEDNSRSDDGAATTKALVTPTTSIVAASVPIPTSKTLWSNLLHSVDQRLNEGMIGKFHARNSSSCRKTNRSSTNSNSGSAIYQILRHGPVLFNHYREENENEK